MSQLNKNFSGAAKQRLTTSIVSKYDDIRYIFKEQENNNTDFEPKVIELGKIGYRNFTLYLYKNKDPEKADVPYEITQLLPTISPVRIDIIVRLNTPSNNRISSYLKVGQVYDDGDIHSKYFEKAIEEEEGEGRPPIP